MEDKFYALVCEFIEELKTKCHSIQSISTLADLKRSRMIFDEYKEKYSEDDAAFVDGEIKGAEARYKKWIETGKEYWREIAADEAEHANIILSNIANIQPREFESLMNRINLIKAKLNK